jgi:hypothetical protein
MASCAMKQGGARLVCLSVYPTHSQREGGGAGDGGGKVCLFTRPRLSESDLSSMNTKSSLKITSKSS